MARSINILTDNAVKNAPAGASLNDGAGLFYRATHPGSGRWVFRFTSSDADYLAQQTAKGSKSRQREMGLGSYPMVKLATARQLARDAGDMVARGIDPIAHKEREAEAEATRAVARARDEEMTFGRYADEVFVPWKLKGFKNAAHIQQWEATFRTHCASLRDKSLSSITPEDVRVVLEPIWDEKNVTATRVRGRLEMLFNHARQKNYYHHDNPAAWSLHDASLRAPREFKDKVKHHASVSHDSVALFLEALRRKQGESMAALMLEWIVLSACRTGEARFAVWSEIDEARGVWAIPAERMKMKRDHVVPITSRMAEILAEAKRRAGHAREPGDIVFTGTKGGALSEMSALMLMRRMKGYEGFTAHGFRATFKTWATECTDYPRELIEDQLAHQLGAVERAYLRGSPVERRRAMMEEWASFCDGKQSTKAAANILRFETRRDYSA